MRMPLSYILLQTLKKGVDRLSEESRSQVEAYVVSQKTEGEAFLNRGNKADLYYTMFGWMLCYVLNIKTDTKVRKAYLDSIHEDELDTLHQSAMKQCRLLHELLSKGLLLASIGNWQHRHHIEEFFQHFAERTYGRGLNATAANLFVGKENKAMSKEESAEGLHYISSLQDETGGFLSNHAAAIPDLLSTAVALFTLRSFGNQATYPAKDFIEVHFGENGAFMPNLLDTQGDVEYEFYGLLALGCA